MNWRTVSVALLAFSAVGQAVTGNFDAAVGFGLAAAWAVTAEFYARDVARMTEAVAGARREIAVALAHFRREVAAIVRAFRQGEAA